MESQNSLKFSANMRDLFHFCAGNNFSLEHSKHCKGQGLMMEAIDWIGQNMFMFNVTTLKVMKTKNTSRSVDLKLQTKSDDIHELIFPSNLQIDPQQGSTHERGRHIKSFR